MSANRNVNQLIVEGYDDLFSVVGLMKGHVDWPEDPARRPVHIEMGNGADEILKDGYLSAFLKGSRIKALGVVLDADTKPRGRYQRIRTLCHELIPALPAELPKDGLVVESAVIRKKFGVWIMTLRAA